MLGGLVGPLVQWGIIAALAMGAVWFIGKSAVNRYKLKLSEKNNKDKDKQRENLANQPRDRDSLAKRLRDGW